MSDAAAAYLALTRARERLETGVRALLAAHGLSPAQYNVLRILRGAGDAGLPCRDIAERLLTKGPDVTRLVDRLEPHGFLVRARTPDDRRVVRVRLSPQGRALLDGLDEPVRQLHEAQFAGLAADSRATLIELLDRIALD